MTWVSRWPGVMCCGNGYLLWERVNKAGKTHKIPCVNRVWAGGCYEEMGLGERERETSEPWVWWQVELVVVVTFALGWAETEWAPVWSVIQILTVIIMTCHPCHVASCHHQWSTKQQLHSHHWLNLHRGKFLEWVLRWGKMFVWADDPSVLWMCHGGAPLDQRCYLIIMSLMIKNESCD